MNWAALSFFGFSFRRCGALAGRECVRFLRVWGQTVLSPVVFSGLYFSVFGAAFASRAQGIETENYLAFLVPGLAVLSGVTTAFQNPSSSMVISKYSGTWTTLLLAPLTPLEKTLGFLAGGALRGMLVVLAVMATGVLLVPDCNIAQPGAFFLATLLGVSLFSLLGALAGIFGKSFDFVSGLTNFVVTPMAFLSGVFYAVAELPAWAAALTAANPIFYIVEGARGAALGISGVPVWLALLIMAVMVSAAFAACLVAFRRIGNE